VQPLIVSIKYFQDLFLPIRPFLQLAFFLKKLLRVFTCTTSVTVSNVRSWPGATKNTNGLVLVRTLTLLLEEQQVRYPNNCGWTFSRDFTTKSLRLRTVYNVIPWIIKIVCFHISIWTFFFLHIFYFSFCFFLTYVWDTFLLSYVFFQYFWWVMTQSDFLYNLFFLFRDLDSGPKG